MRISLDIAEAAEFFEKRGIERMAPRALHVGDGKRGSDDGNSVGFRRLLRACRERPSDCRAAD